MDVIRLAQTTSELTELIQYIGDTHAKEMTQSQKIFFYEYIKQRGEEIRNK